MKILALILPIVALLVSIYALRRSSTSLENAKRNLKNAQEAYRQIKAYAGYEPNWAGEADIIWEHDPGEDIELDRSVYADWQDVVIELDCPSDHDPGQAIEIELQADLVIEWDVPENEVVLAVSEVDSEPNVYEVVAAYPGGRVTMVVDLDTGYPVIRDPCHLCVFEECD
jgi:hypothetical protein